MHMDRDKNPMVNNVSILILFFLNFLSLKKTKTFVSDAYHCNIVISIVAEHENVDFQCSFVGYLYKWKGSLPLYERCCILCR